MNKSNSNAIIETELKSRIGSIENILEADAIAYSGPIIDSVHNFLKRVIEPLQSKRERLVFLLETEGGYVEEAERIVNTLRHHYATVDFIVTSHAMSAGTVLVMSGDAIHMDYSAVLGPIDPQIQRPGGNALVPALGYLEQYERLIRKSAGGQLTSAELAYLIDKFDPAELYY